MKIRSILFAVCVIAVLSSLPILSSTASANCEIRTDCKLDFDLIDAYEALAILEGERFMRRVFAEERKVYFAKVGAQNKNPAEDSLHGAETCEEQLFPPWRASYGATTTGILVLDSKDAARVSTSQSIEIPSGTEFIQRICGAIAMAKKKNHPGGAEEIQAIAEERISKAASYNAEYFQLLRNGHAHPITLRLIQNAESQATPSLVAAVADLFSGIKSLLYSGAQADGEDILSVIEMKNNRALFGISANLKAKFGLLRKLRNASCIIEHGAVGTSSLVQVIKESGFHDYGKVWSSCGKDESKVSIKDQCGDYVEIRIKKCDREGARQTTYFEGVKGMDIFFRTMENELTKACSGNERGTENPYEHGSSNIETGQAGSTTAWKVMFEAIFCSIPKDHPAVSSKNQNLVISEMKNAVHAIYTAIASASNNSSSRTLIERQRNATACRLRRLASDVHAVIRGSQKYPPQTVAALDQARENTICNALFATRYIFGAIQALLDAVSGGAAAGSKDYLSAVEVFHKKALVIAKDWVKSVLQAIKILFPIHPEHYNCKSKFSTIPVLRAMQIGNLV